MKALHVRPQRLAASGRAWRSLLAVAVAGCAACSQQQVPATLAPDAIYHNGKVVTLDERSSIVQAIAVRDGRIVAVGSNDEVRKLAGSQTRFIDFQGRTVLPGLYDNHVHLGVGRNPNTYDWKNVSSVEDLYAVLRRAVSQAVAGEWIQADLATELLPEQVLPTRTDLDAIAPKHPLALHRGHVLLVNSLALQKAGITRRTVNPPGGMIDRDAKGEPNGRIREQPAQRLIRQAIPRWEPEHESALQAIRQTLKGFAAQGLTSVNGGMMRPQQLHLVQEVYERWGNELPRLTMQPRLSPGYDTYDNIQEGIAKEIALLEGMRVHTGFGNDRFKLGAIKMSVDGGMTGQAAWLSEPYKGRPDYRGVVRIPEEALYAVGKRAHDLGWQLGIHAIGDAAVATTVNVLERIVRENPRSDHRHYIHHWSINPSAETVTKAADIGLVVALQPNFTWSLAPYYDNAVEGERLQTNNPTASLLKQGIRMSYGSDGLPLGPFIGLYGAVTRRATEFSGETSGQVVGPGERATLEQALRLYTQGSAYMTFDEKDRGVLQPGKLADFVSISEDIMTVDPERIRFIQPVLTIVGGEIVYSAPDGPRQDEGSQAALEVPSLRELEIAAAHHHQDC